MKENKTKKVVVAMSGGVDSSVSALLLKEQGYAVIGLHMRGENKTTRDDDENRVREICEKLNIPLEVVDYSNQMQIVKNYFISEYKAGRTPNPCVICNREVKFKPFIEFAEKLGADYFATGHYARIIHDGNNHVLLKAVDENKDQSYFLCKLSNKQLEKALFPLGEITKDKVREIARENGLISADTKESYDICFLGSEKFKDFMNKNYPEKSGDMIDLKTGKVVGQHIGISKYTIGQRKGLGIGGGHGETGESWFVSRKDAEKNIIYVSQGNGEELYSSGIISKDFNWLAKIPNNETFNVKAKFRYRQKDQDVKVSVDNDGIVNIIFKEPQRAITLGQFVVLYDNDVCLGGGAISEVIK